MECKVNQCMPTLNVKCKSVSTRTSYRYWLKIFFPTKRKLLYTCTDTNYYKRQCKDLFNRPIVLDIDHKVIRRCEHYSYWVQTRTRSNKKKYSQNCTCFARCCCPIYCERSGAVTIKTLLKKKTYLRPIPYFHLFGY